MPNTEAPPLVVPDYRRHGQPMLTWSLRVPPEMAADLEQQANRLKTTSAGLARALVVRGLQQLQAA